VPRGGVFSGLRSLRARHAGSMEGLLRTHGELARQHKGFFGKQARPFKHPVYLVESAE